MPAYRCVTCNVRVNPHCPKFECGWVICPAHGILRVPKKEKPGA